MELVCQYCKEDRKTRRSLVSHERLCKCNPSRAESNFSKRKSEVPWNKGLSKETDDRVKKNADGVRATMRKKFEDGYRTTIQKEEYWTDLRRREKSEWRKNLHREFPETHPNRKVAGNRNKMTYPEQVAFDWLKNNNVVFEHQKQILGYYVDFCIDNIIIEIDGERWHPTGNEKDATRDLKLTDNGYIIYRIKSKERIEDKLKEIISLWAN